MSARAELTEHWTMTGDGLILAGCRATIHALLPRLGLPLDAPVRLTPSQAAIALWGESLDTYLRHYRTSESVVEQSRAVALAG